MVKFLKTNYKYAIGFASILVVAMILIFSTNGKEIYAKHIYRDVVKQLKNFKSISFMFNLYSWKLNITYVEDHYFSIKSPSTFESVHDFKKGEERILIHFIKNYLIKPKPANEFDEWYLLDDLKNLSEEADEELGIKMIDGISCTGFRSFKEDGNVKIDIWIGEKSKELVYVEINMGGEITFRLTDIKIDHLNEYEIDSLTIPSDYKPLPEDKAKELAPWIRNHQILSNPQKFKFKFEEK